MSNLTLLPAVDVADGQAVRLVQGAAGSETSYGDPVEAALAWQQAGAEWLHLVDLDAAFGRGSNAPLLAEVVATVSMRVEMSGGIRDDESLERALATGCERVNIGTAALENPGWVAGDHRQVRRQDRGRPGRARHDARGARLDGRGRRAVRDAGAAGRRGLRPVRGDRRAQGRHAAADPTSACCAASARRLTARSWPAGECRRSMTCAPWPRWCRPAWRARSSARPCTPARSPWPRRSRQCLIRQCLIRKCPIRQCRRRQCRVPGAVVTRRKVSSGGPFEEVVGYSRAVAAGDFIFVSGCTSIVDGEVAHEGDLTKQTEQAILIAGAGAGRAGREPRRRGADPDVRHRHHAVARGRRGAPAGIRRRGPRGHDGAGRRADRPPPAGRGRGRGAPRGRPRRR